jgi:hypothetical protein
MTAGSAILCRARAFSVEDGSGGIINDRSKDEILSSGNMTI